MTEYEIRTTYTQEIHNMTPAAIWAAWESGELTVYQVYTYQEKQGILFTPKGKVIK